MKILISIDPNKKIHTTNWSKRWNEYCIQNGIECEMINLLSIENAVEKIKDCDILLWHFGQYNLEHMLEARSLLYVAKNLGKVTFPAFEDAWHFDDKIAEMYALQAFEAPIPLSEAYYDYDLFKDALINDRIKIPIVAKLKSGSGSHNVKLIKSKSQLKSYAKKMLKGKGFKAAPSLIYKASSNFRSSHDWETFKAKLKRAPEFLRTLAGAKRFPREKGYVYLQEFIPNDGYDMKIVVVNGKCSGFCRPVRSHDFRASGGGEIYYDQSKLTKDIVDSAFRTAERLKLQCVGFDYVVDNRTGLGKIVEMSYGFYSDALIKVGGYYDRNYQWHEEPRIVENEIIDYLSESYFKK